jgi:GR25 family glycosyltransferase involved in LPS biosynthesis
MANTTLNGIDRILVVNLARRKDRLDTFVENHPELRGLTTVHEAVDGCALELTPAIARMLRPNGFFWKKPVAGCSFSHLAIWYRLAMEPNATNYLVLEDDAKLATGWMDTWNNEFANAPEDWDVLYLGGVIPPNKHTIPLLSEPVSGQWCRIALNQIFGQSAPSRYFHFCTYSYALSKR